MCICIIYLHLLAPSAERVKEHNAPVAMSTPRAHTLLSKYRSPSKGTNALWWNGQFHGWCRVNLRGFQNILLGQKVIALKNDEGISQGQSQLEGAPIGQICDSLSTK